MMPALLIRRFRRDALRVMVAAATLMLAKDDRSSWRKVTGSCVLAPSWSSLMGGALCLWSALRGRCELGYALLARGLSRDLSQRCLQ